MVFNEKANGKVTMAGMLLVLALGVLTIPRWSVAQPPPQPTPAAVDPTAPPPATPQFTPTAPVPPSTVVEVPVAAEPPQADNAPTEARRYAIARTGEDGVVQVVQLPDGKTSLRIKTIADGTLSIEIEQDGKVVQQQMLPVVVLRTAPGRYPQGGRFAQPPGVAAHVYNPQTGVGTSAAPAAEHIGITAQPPVTVAPVPDNVPAAVRYRMVGPPQRDPADIDLLKVDCELAKVTVEKKEIELDQARESSQKSPGSIAPSQIRLLELGVREAQLQLQKCELRLAAEERGQEQRQAEPEGARR